MNDAFGGEACLPMHLKVLFSSGGIMDIPIHGAR